MSPFVLSIDEPETVVVEPDSVPLRLFSAPGEATLSVPPAVNLVPA